MEMRILQVINSLATGGAEKLLLETLPLYRDKGIEMDLLVLNGSDHPFMKQLKELNCCTIYSLKLKSVYNPIAIIKMMPYLFKYDLIHVHLFPAQYFVVLAKMLSFSNVKLIFTEHNTTNRRMGNRILQLFDRFIYSKYYKVVCITNEVKQILQQHLGSRLNKFVVIENGVNIESIKKAKPYLKEAFHLGINNKDVIMIQVAGFREQKDQVTVIKALHYLPNNYKLLLVGDGVLRKSCEDLVLELQLQNRVCFLGLRMDIPQLLKTADIVVLSSKYEGLSLSSIEGMASGRPFVASDVPGLSEIVSGAGVLFECGNAKELANHIKELLTNKFYYEEIVKTCQARAEQYDIKILIQKHIELYNTVLKF